MSDIAFFKKHFDELQITIDDLTEKGDVGVNSGLAKAKGYSVDTEVLTSEGWLLFPAVKDRLLAEMEMFKIYSTYASSRAELSNGDSGNKVFGDEELLRQYRYSYIPLLVASATPYDFNESTKERVGKSGRIVFTQPIGFHEWLYSRNIVRIKMRGIDVRMTPYAEIIAKRKYRNGYGFVKANDLYENKYGEYFYLGLNKFTRSISEKFTPIKAHIFSEGVISWWDNILRKTFISSDGQITPEHKEILTAWENRNTVETLNAIRANTGHILGLADIAGSYLPNSIIPSEIFVEGRGAEIIPNEYATRYAGYRDYVYNLSTLPYRNIIIRKHKPDESERKWLGKPLVVGDGSDKGMPENGNYITGKTVGVRRVK